MAIVPIYRLRAAGNGDTRERRYRFSREPTPDPNPHPGEPDEDHDTVWIVEGVAFYAWSDQVVDGEHSSDLKPVYEFHRCSGRRHHYYYSLERDAPRGWVRRPYVAFWAHAEDVEVGAPAVYRYEQDRVRRRNFALSVEREVEGWTRLGAPAFYASERVPVRVSVRRDPAQPGRRQQYDWTFDPSTVNLAYGSILELVPASNCEFAFTGFEVVQGGDDFERPIIRRDRIQVRAKCSTRGKDYKYNVRVRMNGQRHEILGDPEIVNQTPPRL